MHTSLTTLIQTLTASSVVEYKIVLRP